MSEVVPMSNNSSEIFSQENAVEFENVEGSSLSISKSFDFSEITSRVEVYGSREEPLFRLNQIEKILGKTNLRGTVADFDEDEKTVKIAYTLGGEQNATFLTEAGIIRLMHVVRGSEIARSFRKWIVNVVKTIRLEGRYELQTSQTKLLADAESARDAAEKEAQEAKAALEKANEESLKREELLDKLRRRIKNKHAKGQTVYLLRNPCDRQRSLWKIGFTKDLSNRECHYKTSMPDGPETVHCRYTTNGRLVESLVHHIVDDHRYVENHEWFEGDPEWFASVIDMAVDFVDGLTELGDRVVPFDMKSKFNTLLRKARRFDPQEDEEAELSEASSSDSVLVVSGGTNTIVVNVNQVVPAQRFIRECLEKARPPEENQIEYSYVVSKFREWGESQSVAVAVGREEVRTLKAPENLGPPKNTSLHKDKWQSVLGYSAPADKTKTCPDVYGWKGWRFVDSS